MNVSVVEKKAILELSISIATKMHVFQALVMSDFLCELETWAVTQQDIKN